MIHVRGVHKSFGPLPVLQGADLHVAAGEVAVLVGPSGGGKSTLLRCLNGLESFDAGDVEVGGLRLRPGLDGRRDAALLQQVRQKAGFVFQQFHLFPHMTVLQNLMEAPVHVRRQTPAVAAVEARRLLDRVGLADKADAYPRQLSGGQQQRVAICRTLAMQPAVVLMDEPTSALDPAMAAEVEQVIVDLARAGQTMVVVTHAMRLVEAVGGRVWRVDQGRVQSV